MKKYLTVDTLPLTSPSSSHSVSEGGGGAHPLLHLRVPGAGAAGHLRAEVPRQAGAHALQALTRVRAGRYFHPD